MLQHGHVLGASGRTASGTGPNSDVRTHTGTTSNTLSLRPRSIKGESDPLVVRGRAGTRVKALTTSRLITPGSLVVRGGSLVASLTPRP